MLGCAQFYHADLLFDLLGYGHQDLRRQKGESSIQMFKV